MKIFKVLSILMSYPEADWVNEIDELRQLVITEERISSDIKRDLNVLIDFIDQTDLIQVQENYVSIFDRNPSHSLHLFEHIHGEDRQRGEAMVNLLEEYKKYDLMPINQELPDFLPLFLEFLSRLDEATLQEYLADAIHVIAHIGCKLEGNQSAYSALFKCLISLSDTEPEEMQVAPVRDMDEAMEMFGPNDSGIEPLLKPDMQQTITFHKNVPGINQSHGLKH